ncbi:MAG: hypothetical protein PHR28_14495 [candidate division Zixibacteria bacterium]|nr:hypothetical protein [candidate division Zixibacteria bacterium]
MNLLGRFNNLSLRAKFVTIISLFIVASCALVSTYLISKHIEAAEQGLIKKGSALIKVLATNCEYGTAIENEAVLDELISATGQADDIIYIMVQNLNGDILASEAMRDDLELQSLPPVKVGENLQVRRMTQPGIDEYFYELTYPVVTSRGIVSRETLGTVGKSRGKVVTEVIGSVRLGISVSATFAEAI